MKWTLIKMVQELAQLIRCLGRVKRKMVCKNREKEHLNNMQLQCLYFRTSITRSYWEMTCIRWWRGTATVTAISTSINWEGNSGMQSMVLWISRPGQDSGSNSRLHAMAADIILQTFTLLISLCLMALIPRWLTSASEFNLSWPSLDWTRRSIISILH